MKGTSAQVLQRLFSRNRKHSNVLNHYSFPFYWYKKSRFLEVFKVFQLICTRYLVIFTVLKLSFVFLKVSNWSVTFLSSAHVLFILASISPTCPLSPPHVSSSCFLYKTEKLSKVAKTKQTKHSSDQPKVKLRPNIQTQLKGTKDAPGRPWPTSA